MADIGALLSGITGSLAQGRDYNLAVARAGESARLRLRGIELQEREAELNRLRFEQAREETRIKTLAETEDLKAKIREAKRETGAEAKIAAGRFTGPTEEPRPSAEELSTAYQRVGLEVPPSIEEQLKTPIQRRARKADIEFKEAQTVESVRRAARPVDGAGTQKERDRAKWLSLDTPEDERALIERDLFGGKTTIDGVSLNDIRITTNILYPESFGIREGVPEGIDPNSFELIRHVAQLVKQGQGTTGLVPIPDQEITVDSLFVR